MSDKTCQIEIQGPNGVRVIDVPACWTIHDVAPVLKIMIAAGYENAVPQTEGVVFAFAPKVEPDELPRETPFDAPFDLPELDDLDGGWIRHDGGECPVHPMDVVEIINDLGGRGASPLPAHRFYWFGINFYRHLRDEDGVPYCSAEGLHGKTKYVATDPHDGCYGYDAKPHLTPEKWCGYPGARVIQSPSSHLNTREHWTKTLRRVWREEA